MNSLHLQPLEVTTADPQAVFSMVGLAGELRDHVRPKNTVIDLGAGVSSFSAKVRELGAHAVAVDSAYDGEGAVGKLIEEKRLSILQHMRSRGVRFPEKHAYYLERAKPLFDSLLADYTGHRHDYHGKTMEAFLDSVESQNIQPPIPPVDLLISSQFLSRYIEGYGGENASQIGISSLPRLERMLNDKGVMAIGPFMDIQSVLPQIKKVVPNLRQKIVPLQILHGNNALILNK
jgi:hypothetical protein